MTGVGAVAPMARRARAAFDLRHAVRLQRFELVAFGLLVAGLAAAAIGIAGVLDATGYGAACDPMLENPPACGALGSRFYDLENTWALPIKGLLLAVPFLLGATAGPPLVARELERGTARLTWALAPSRLRWFLARLGPLALTVLGLALVCGLALDRLAAAINPWTDPWRSFDEFGLRGPVLAGRALFVFAIGVTCGAVVGRTLPALLLTVVIGWIGITGGAWVHARWMASEAVFVAEDGTGASTRGALFIDQRLQDDTGRILSWDEAYALVPPDDTTPWPPAGWRYLDLVVPAERFPYMAARELGALGGATGVAFAIAAVAVRRRRPG